MSKMSIEKINSCYCKNLQVSTSYSLIGKNVVKILGSSCYI